MPELPSPGGRLWTRLLLGAVVIVLATAGATAVAAFREVDRVVEALKTGEGLELGDGLAETDAGRPQTLLLIGSDRRAAGSVDARIESSARSDTMVLARLDPGKGATALLSLPRDLKVKIPGHGTDKLNAAYRIGGPKLTLETIKELTGLRINHVVNVDFRGFRQAVNAIGCVYVDIDRRYFNDNSGPERYATIDVKQGYQRLCGRDALDYVRYRHEDNDLVRAARQQDFLRQAKAQVGLGRLISDRERLVRIFGRYTRSDIDTRAGVLRLLKLAIASADRPIREVHFEGRVGATFVTASQARMRKLTEEFLGVESTKGPRGSLPTERPAPRRPRRPQRALLEDASGPGREQAKQARAAGASIPVYYPARRTPRSLFVGAPRAYRVRDLEGAPHSSYRMVLRRGLVGEYYGLQGTAWRNPPILEGPSELRRLGGRTFEIHRDGDRVRLVAWRTPKAVYWISNTLLQSLSEKQMLALAQSTKTL